MKNKIPAKIQITPETNVKVPRQPMSELEHWMTLGYSPAKASHWLTRADAKARKRAAKAQRKREKFLRKQRAR